jgi:23S rRNA pseudouridine1911/1915/1917 synthase
MVVHPAAGHADGTLVNGLLHHIDDLSGIGGVQRPGIVHRLDRDTSGLLVVAKHDRAHQHLAAQFADHSARRRYLAVCLGTPSSLRGTVRSHLARHPKDRVRFATTELPGKGKHAITHWAIRGKGRGLALLEFELETGRTHQIRVHATESGWPLCGDPMYKRRGVRAPAWARSEGLDARTMLHAWRLRLVHPSNDTLVTFRAKPPTDFQALLDAAGIPGALDEGWHDGARSGS